MQARFPPFPDIPPPIPRPRPPRQSKFLSRRPPSPPPQGTPGAHPATARRASRKGREPGESGHAEAVGDLVEARPRFEPHALTHEGRQWQQAIAPERACFGADRPARFRRDIGEAFARAGRRASVEVQPEAALGQDPRPRIAQRAAARALGRRADRRSASSVS